MNNLSRGRTTLTFIGIILGYFIALLDTTIVNISLPKTAEYFNTFSERKTWRCSRDQGSNSRCG